MKEVKMKGDVEVALDYVLRYTGRWYRWGGSDPAGFDCSGLALEYLYCLGIFDPRCDYTAQGIFDRLVASGFPTRGDLVFWGKADDRITHVEIMLTCDISFGASGGGRHVVDIRTAERADAFIKARHMRYRRTPIGYCRPLLYTGD